MRTIGVIGSGTMGSGIVQTFAEHDFDVMVFESHQTAREKAEVSIPKFIRKRAEKAQITSEEAESSIQRIRWCAELEELSKSDFVIEAIFEDLAAKIAIFRKLDEITPSNVILASNTSSL